MGQLLEKLESRRLFASLLPGDFNNDGYATTIDFTIMSAHWMKAATRSTGDANGDGKCDAHDFTALLRNFGQAWRWGKPGSTSTGPTKPWLLKSSGSITVTTPGAIIENVSVSGTINIKARNVIVRNFRVNANNFYGIRLFTDASATIVDGEIYNADTAAVAGGNYSAIRLNVHDMGSDAFNVWDNNDDAGSFTSVQNCWVHRIDLSPGAHADGVQVASGHDLMFVGNNFDVPIDSPDGSSSNACFLISSDGGVLDDILIEGNWLNGGNYTIYSYGSNVRVISNTFGNDYRYGILAGSVAKWID